MPGRNYPIWNDIDSCIYSGSGERKSGNKSYGVRQHGDCTVRVGTSRSNSHVFVEHSVTHREHGNGDREYRFYLDGEVVKCAILRKGASELEWSKVQ